jgi:hypothetical protein
MTGACGPYNLGGSATNTRVLQRATLQGLRDGGDGAKGSGRTGQAEWGSWSQGDVMVARWKRVRKDRGSNGGD